LVINYFVNLKNTSNVLSEDTEDDDGFFDDDEKDILNREFKPRLKTR
jgi:hypothetical protein